MICCKKEATKVVPTVTIAAVTNITATTAASEGEITSDGGATVTAHGICWSTNQNPTIADNKTTNGTGTGSFTSSLTGLTPGATYYVRAYATNNIGTGYGNNLSFTTIQGSQTVTDIDGNIYHTITIGTQVWMVENLKTTKYRDNTAIPNVIDNIQWVNLSTLTTYLGYSVILNTYSANNVVVTT